MNTNKNKTIRISETLSLMIVLLCFNAASAQDASREETKRLTNLLQKLEGTYQVQIIDSREKLAFPLNTLDKIESKRQENDTAYFWMKDNVKVVILPKSVLARKDFSPLERVVYRRSH